MRTSFIKNWTHRQTERAHMKAELSDIDAISRYWVARYADMMRDDFRTEALPYSIVAIVGHESDAIGWSKARSGGEVNDAAWITGYLNFPCDAVYTSVAFKLTEDTAICWTHLHPTSETRVLAIGIDREAKRYQPLALNELLEDDYFAPLVDAAHEFDRFNIEDGIKPDRKLAREIVQKEPRSQHEFQFLAPSCLLDLARSSVGTQR